MKGRAETTKLGFYSLLNTPDFRIYVREQAAALLGKFLHVYLYEEQREGYGYMVITVQKCRGWDSILQSSSRMRGGQHWTLCGLHSHYIP